jgi:hypothetical protein
VTRCGQIVDREIVVRLWEIVKISASFVCPEILGLKFNGQTGQNFAKIRTSV